MWVYSGALGPDLKFMDNNAEPHRVHIINDILKKQIFAVCIGIWNLSEIGHIWAGLERVIAQPKPLSQ